MMRIERETEPFLRYSRCCLPSYARTLKDILPPRALRASAARSSPCRQPTLTNAFYHYFDDSHFSCQPSTHAFLRAYRAGPRRHFRAADETADCLYCRLFDIKISMSDVNDMLLCWLAFAFHFSLSALLPNNARLKFFIRRCILDYFIISLHFGWMVAFSVSLRYWRLILFDALSLIACLPHFCDDEVNIG